MRTEIEALKEIRDRISYFCSRTDGKYDPPWAQEVIGIIDDVLITLQWQADEAAGVAGTTDKPHSRSAAEAVVDMEFEINAALSAPPRNCDMPLVVDGPADNNADKAWIVFKRHNPDAYFDVPGLLRCIDWLLAPATEKEGGNK